MNISAIYLSLWHMARFFSSSKIEFDAQKAANDQECQNSSSGKMKKVNLSEVRDHLAHYLREAHEEEVVITRHGKPVGVLIGFTSEEDWLDYLLENNPRFAKRIDKARHDLRAGLGVSLEAIRISLENRIDATANQG
jgi:prevent-host-death family protein